MVLILPKYVEIADLRLRFIYYAMVTIVIVCLGCRFFINKMWAREVIPLGYAGAWPDGLGDTALLTAASEQEFCKKASSFEYWWDESSQFRYGPHSCVQPCGSPALAKPCIFAQEAFIQETPDQIFFATEFTEEVFGVNASRKSYLVPFEDAMQVGISYFFEMDQPNAFSSSSNDAEEKTSYSSNLDILTVLVDSNHEQLRVFRPPQPITLNISDVLRLAGRSLDDIQEQSGPNRRPDAVPPYSKGPLTRISGVELKVVLSCYRDVHNMPQTMDLEWQGPVCQMSVESTSAWWVFAKKTENIDGTVRTRSFHGIRLRFVVTGSYIFLDINSILQSIVSVLVFVTIPQKVILFIMVWLLGHLSNIYRSMIYEEVDLLQQCTGMATRLLSMSAAFNELEDVDSGDRSGISRERLHSQLVEIMRHRSDVLDEAEIEGFVYCIYHQMLTKRKNEKLEQQESNLNLVSQLMRQASRQLQTHRVEADLITIDDFSAAHASIERFSFQDCVKLFDKDRGTCCIERFFTPWNIKNAMGMATSTGKRRSLVQSIVPPASASMEPEVVGAELMPQTNDDSDRKRMTDDDNSRMRIDSRPPGTRLLKTASRLEKMDSQFQAVLDSRTEAKFAKDELSCVRSAFESLQAEVKASQERLSGVLGSLEGLRAEVNAIAAEGSAMPASLHSLRAEAEAASSALSDLDSRTAELAAALAASQGDSAALRAQLDEIQGVLRRVEEDHASGGSSPSKRFELTIAEAADRSEQAAASNDSNVVRTLHITGQEQEDSRVRQETRCVQAAGSAGQQASSTWQGQRSVGHQHRNATEETNPRHDIAIGDIADAADSHNVALQLLQHMGDSDSSSGGDDEAQQFLPAREALQRPSQARTAFSPPARLDQHCVDSRK